ncbi:MAG: hypothetical protein B6245_09895 [Desulfobacteraceae bacterium 4572_88]|nr:MAG: hypothetical protein B6245_09895 [Desulfobacteraceae bacterium 4572_88]
MVLDTGLDHRQREYLSLARHSAGSLLYMLNGLLDLSRIEAGKTDINHRNFNLASLMKSAVVPVRLEAEKKGLKMEYAVSGDIPDILTGDPELLRRVFLNLVRNAVKFTEKGRVSVQVRKTGSRTDQQVRLVFSVADTGIGIPADKLGTIFETFSQTDGSIRRKYGGTGLGLTIAKKLVEHMGGDIRVKSEVGQGSTFCFELSFDPQNAETRADAADDLSDHAMLSPSPPPALPRDRIRILLAEDDRVNQKVISCILENAGYEVMIVPDGKAVLEILEHVRFSLILMDVRMPEMDGLETTRRIRNPTGVIESGGIPRFRTDLPIIALTANVLTKDREMCFEAGMNDYLPKPADRQTLVEKTEKFVPSVPGTKNGETFSLSLFWEKGFSCFQSLKADFSRGEQEKTESHAHQIKKMASDAGAYKIADEVFRFELALRKGNVEKAGAMFERMENAFHALKALLENQNWKSARSEIEVPNMNTTPENGN